MIDGLEKIPEWVWHPEYSWDEYKIFTTGFIHRYGRMPQRDDMFHTARIGRWVAKQLDDEICGRITTAHYAELDSIENFTWNVRLMWCYPRGTYINHRIFPSISADHHIYIDFQSQANIIYFPIID